MARASCLVCQLPPEKLNQVHALSLSGVPWREIAESVGVTHPTVMKHWKECAPGNLDLEAMRAWMTKNSGRVHKQLERATTTALTQLPTAAQAAELTPALIAARLMVLEAAGYELYKILSEGGDTRNSIAVLTELRKLVMSMATVAERLMEMEREQGGPVQLEPIKQYEYDRSPPSDAADREDLALKIEQAIEQRARQIASEQSAVNSPPSPW